MELATGYLFTLAALAMAFVGFVAIVVILRQSLGSKVLPIDALVARLFMVWGFTVAYAAMLPIVLAAYDLPAPVVWRVASAVNGLWLVFANLSYPWLRFRATGENTPIHVQLHVGVAVATGFVLLANAAAPFPKEALAIYLSATTFYLAHASFAFVQHFGFMLRGVNAKPRHRKL